MSEKIVPPPGSDEAIAMGCCCPVHDNCRGKGWMGQEGVYWINENCPIHGKKKKDDNLIDGVEYEKDIGYTQYKDRSEKDD